jgi:hypothetical protein
MSIDLSTKDARDAVRAFAEMVTLNALRTVTTLSADPDHDEKKWQQHAKFHALRVIPEPQPEPPCVEWTCNGSRYKALAHEDDGYFRLIRDGKEIDSVSLAELLWRHHGSKTWEMIDKLRALRAPEAQ